jgi:hypothetical protein
MILGIQIGSVAVLAGVTYSRSGTATLYQLVAANVKKCGRAAERF